MVIWQARLTGRPTLVMWGAEGVSVARRSPSVGRDPCFSCVRRRARGAIGRVALCVAVDPGGRGDASAACAWLSDPTATASIVRTNASFPYIDSVPRSPYVPGEWGHPGPGRPPPGRIALISARAVRRSVPGFARHAAHPGVMAIIAVHGVHRRAGTIRARPRSTTKRSRPRYAPAPGSSTSCPPPPCPCGW